VQPELHRSISSDDNAGIIIGQARVRHNFFISASYHGPRGNEIVCLYQRIGTARAAYTPTMIALTWDDIEELVGRLVARLPRDYDLILVITRGGMVPACLISERLDLRNIVAAAVMFYTEGTSNPDEMLGDPVFLEFPADPLLTGKRVLIVDDVWETGKTAMVVRRRVREAGGRADLAVLHYKPGRSAFSERPDYFAETTEDWVAYPWDPTRARDAVGEAAGYPGKNPLGL
jgi:hypoxanthine phosphoribosyltransferase